jgi:hypothetical protein
MMDTWEYEAAFIKEGEREIETMNKWGKVGWELVAMHWMQPLRVKGEKIGNGWLCVFKRRTNQHLNLGETDG